MCMIQWSAQREMVAGFSVFMCSMVERTFSFFLFFLPFSVFSSYFGEKSMFLKSGTCV